MKGRGRSLALWIASAAGLYLCALAVCWLMTAVIGAHYASIWGTAFLATATGEGMLLAGWLIRRRKKTEE